MDLALACRLRAPLRLSLAGGRGPFFGTVKQMDETLRGELAVKTHYGILALIGELRETDERFDSAEGAEAMAVALLTSARLICQTSGLSFTAVDVKALIITTELST